MFVAFMANYNKADEYPNLRQNIDNALKEMGSGYVLGDYKKFWSKNEPESGYCHAVTEVLLRSDLVPEGSVAWRIPTKEGSHYCIKTPDGDFLDFTNKQHFAEPVNYDKGEPRSLAETAERYDSFLSDDIVMRVPILAEKLGLKLKPLPSLKKVIKENMDRIA